MSRPDGTEEGPGEEPGGPATPEAVKAAPDADHAPAIGAAVAAESAEPPAVEPGGEEPEEDLPPLVPVLEAALFASAEAVPLTRLTRVLGAWTRKQVVAGLKELLERQEREGSGVRVVETGGGYQLRSVVEYSPWVRKFFAEKPPRLSRAVLETLAVVAYRQPATRGEIEAVRGVNCDAVLGALTARGLIQIVGRRPTPGSPMEYGTTTEFLELFSLRALSELPPLPDPSSLASLIEEAGGEEGDGGVAGESDEADGTADAQEVGSGERDEIHGDSPRTTAEDPEPGGDRIPKIGGDADPGGQGSGQREGDSGARGEG